ncbi:MAG: hypothetical protein Q9195_005970 [Heterodermia aff. obscurata]
MQSHLINPESVNAQVDLSSILRSLATKHVVDLPYRKEKAHADDEHKDTEGDIAADQDKIFVPLYSKEELDNFRGEPAHAQLVTQHDGAELVLPAHALNHYQFGNIHFTIIDSSLQHAFNLTVVIENSDPTTNHKKLPPDLRAEGCATSGLMIKRIASK